MTARHPIAKSMQSKFLFNISKLSSIFGSISIALVVTACAFKVPAEQPQAAPGQAALEPAEKHVEFADQHLCLHSHTPPSQSQQGEIAANTIWEEMPLGYLIKWQHNARIQAELNWYIRNPSYMKRVSKRAERYAYYVSQQLALRGMPQELALLPIVESAYDPFAYSHGRAAGMWQFIPGTARVFNLKIDWWYDGRRDIVASTQAAINYLDKLQRYYDGDWLLALAAYNAGQGNVNKAIRKNRKAGKPTDFWNLKLPRETRSYVPKLLALSELISRPQHYDIELYPVANQPYFAQVDTETQIDLAEAAAIADVDINDLYRLNPAFNRWATSPDGPHRLLIPVDKAQAFQHKLAQIPPEQRLHWIRHKVKNGESLLLLAKRYHTDAKVIRQVNQLRNNTIRIGQQLLIPTASKDNQHYALSSEQRLQRIYKQRTGTVGSEQVFHKVRSGESLWTIARKYGVKVASIAHWNGMAPRDTIRPGQKLSIWVDKTSKVEMAGLQREPVMRKIGYTVRRGDSLARIADKFNIRIKDIVEWNAVNTRKYLQPGQYLTLYVDITRGIN
jgi:membrane-bound lytic murein transglycosylase D